MREGKNEKNGDWKVGIFIVSFSLAMGISIWASAAVGHNEANNNPLTAAQDHISENRDGIRELMVEAAREDPGILQVIAGLPEQGLNAVCTTPQNDPQAREAIGRTSRTCRISLYGETSQVEAEYLIFMDYRKYSIWETVRNRMEYPIRDAYMDVSSLEVASPHRALRVGPEGNDPRKTAGTSPALRLTGLEKKR